MQPTSARDDARTNAGRGIAWGRDAWGVGMIPVLSVLALCLSLAGVAFWLYTAAMRQDWPGVGLGVAVGLWMVVTGVGWIQLDRALRRGSR